MICNMGGGGGRVATPNDCEATPNDWGGGGGGGGGLGGGVGGEGGGGGLRNVLRWPWVTLAETRSA